MNAISRRQFLRAAGAAVAAGAITQALPWTRLSPFAEGEERDFRIQGQQTPDRFFPQSVASGDPTPTGAVLWTRVDPDHLNKDGVIAVEVSADESFDKPVRRATVPASIANEANAYTVRIDLDGELEADRHYHYRFIHEGQATRTGRLRTLPEPGADKERLKLAVLTCQNYQNGYFSALGHVANEDVDYIVHLGDFIYEYNGEASYNGKSYEDRAIKLPSGAPRSESREDLDYLWARYRSDEHLRAALERHTLIATWDDHEIANDRSFDYDKGHHIGDGGFHLTDGGKLDAYFRDGAQAYFDWLPLRIQVDKDSADPLDVITLYRDFQFGNLAQIWMLDERWFRSPPAGAALEPSQESLSPTSQQRIDPNATMLGKAQKDWLAGSLAGTNARWKLFGNAVQTSPLAASLPGTSVYVNLDGWDGYEADRQWFMDALSKQQNNVILTGDLHTYMVSYVKKDYETQGAEPAGNRVAVEFMTPGVTSAGLGEIIEEQSGKPQQPGDDEILEAAVLSGNPHMTHFNSSRHGYSIVELTKRHARYYGYVVDKANSGVKGNKHLMSVWECPVNNVALRELQYNSPSGLSAVEATRVVQANDPRRDTPAGTPPPGSRVVRDLAELPAALKASKPGMNMSKMRPKLSILDQ